MTISEIKEKIEEIKKKKDDDEVAHGIEDNLYYDFIDYIAELDIGELAEMAKEIQRIRLIDFARWRA